MILSSDFTLPAIVLFRPVVIVCLTCAVLSFLVYLGLCTFGCASPPLGQLTDLVCGLSSSAWMECLFVKQRSLTSALLCWVLLFSGVFGRQTVMLFCWMESLSLPPTVPASCSLDYGLWDPNKRSWKRINTKNYSYTKKARKFSMCNCFLKKLQRTNMLSGSKTHNLSPWPCEARVKSKATKATRCTCTGLVTHIWGCVHPHPAVNTQPDIWLPKAWPAASVRQVRGRSQMKVVFDRSSHGLNLMYTLT